MAVPTKWILFVLTALALSFTDCLQAQPANTTLFRELDATLQPGVLQGFALGDSSERCAYIAKIIPLEASTNGAHIDKYFIEPEYDGKSWNDVLRIILPDGTTSPLKVHVLIYKISAE